MSTKFLMISLMAIISIYSNYASAAIMMAASGSDVSCNYVHAKGCNAADYISTTTSLPTVLIMDSEAEVNLSSPEVQARLLAEARGDAEVFLIPGLSRELNVSIEILKSAILFTDASSEELTVENIQTNLQR